MTKDRIGKEEKKDVLVSVGTEKVVNVSKKVVNVSFPILVYVYPLATYTSIREP